MIMYISIFQINLERDSDRIKYQDLPYLPKQYQGKPDASLYDQVFDGEVLAKHLDDIFALFNTSFPEGFSGHSLSVSDVIWVQETGGYEEITPGFYFVSAIGFTKVEFRARSSYDAVFWEIPEGYGMTPAMLKFAQFLMPDAEEYLPMEIDNDNGASSAMGFLDMKAYDEEERIRKKVRWVIDDIYHENSTGDYVLEDGKAPLRIRLMR